jgi:TonB family protein
LKSIYSPKTKIPWKSLLIFFLVAAVWHLPLLLAPKPKEAPLAQSSPQNTFLFLQSSTVTPNDLQVLWSDPTIYVLPGDYGFSSRLRSVKPHLKEEHIKSTLVDLSSAFEPTHTEDLEVGVENLMWDPTPFETDLTTETSSVPKEKAIEEGSAWLVSGNLAKRLISSSSTLPLLVSTELLAPSVLRICVGENGSVLYCMVEKSSGFDNADDAALRFARGIRFQSQSDASNVWGTVKVFWRAEAQAIKS